MERPARWRSGLRTWVERTGTTNARLAAILSGANMNFDRPDSLPSAPSLAGAEALFGVTIPNVRARSANSARRSAAAW